MRGEFFFSYAHRGWLWGDGDRRVSQLMIDEHKAPFVWTFCPWCQGELPSFSAAFNPNQWVDPDLRKPEKPEQPGEAQDDGN